MASHQPELHDQNLSERLEAIEQRLASEADEHSSLIAIISDLQAMLLATHKHAEAEREHLLQREQAARAEAEAIQRYVSFLANASVVLASSLDYATTLRHIVRLVVPELADYCVVFMRQPNGVIARVMRAHRNPVKELLLANSEDRYNIDPHDDTNPVVRVIGHGMSVVFADVQPEQITLVSPALAQPEIHAQVEPRSYIVVPLVTHGRVLGAISFLYAESDRHYGPNELALAEELGRRAATCIENTRLYAAEQQARQAAEAAVNMRDQFLSIASHELKTPLTSLSGYAQLIQRRTRKSRALNDRDAQALDVVVEQANRLNRLVSALLDLSRIQTGELDIAPVLLDLRALVQLVVEEAQPMIQDHDLETEMPQVPVLVVGDQLRLQQVIDNLVQNALKYSPAGGTVRVELTQEAGRAYVMVSDEGMGIPNEALSLVFGRFYRAANVDAQHISGLGIGLYIARQIAELHGGSVSVSSVEGQGSTFRVVLPLHQAAGQQTQGEFGNGGLH